MEKISMATTTATTIAEQHKLVEINSTNTNTINLNTEENEFDYDKIPLEVNSVRSGIASRTNFKKSNTCGSLYAKCSCNTDSSTSVAPLITDTDLCDKERKKLQRNFRQKNQSFSHPDTSIVFTEQNRYPLPAQDSTQWRSETINTKNGLVEIKSSGKRASSPNLRGHYELREVAVHPELQVKIGPKTDRPVLKKNSKSFPSNNLSSQLSFDSVESAGTTGSIEDDTESELIEKTKQFMITDLDESSSESYKSKQQQENSKHSADSNDLENNLSCCTSLNCEQQITELESEAMGSVSSIAKKTSKIKPIVADSKAKENIRRDSLVLIQQLNNQCRYSVSECQMMEDANEYIVRDIQNSNHDTKTLSLQDEIVSLRQTIKSRDEEINKLKREIHKLKSVLQQTTQNFKTCECDLLSSLQSNYGMAGQTMVLKNIKNGDDTNTATMTVEEIALAQQQQQQQSQQKKQGVSGESCDFIGQSSDILIRKYEKDFKSKQLIKDAIMDNDFLKHLDSIQIRELVDSMYSRDVEYGEYVVREGDPGKHLFVSAEGEFEVIVGGKTLGVMGPKKAFGELAILYNCTRTASIKAVRNSKVWVLDRRAFQQIMLRTGLQRIEENVKFLKSVSLLQNLNDDVLNKIADVLEVEFYPEGTYIIRQGARGDTFFLISQGNVKVTQRLPGSSMEEEIRVLNRGEYFGEQALIKEDKRTANIIAMSPGVECLTLDRESFNQHIGDICELREKDYGDKERFYALKKANAQPMPVVNSIIDKDYADIELKDLSIVATVGIGGFGRVELVKYSKNNVVKIFALKQMKKQHIIDTKQEEHVYNERKIMLSMSSPFICRLYRTFRDKKYIYLLLEACMGGEVWTILRNQGRFNEPTAQFIVGCVIQAFEYLHTRGIVYRDLKPENLMLSSHGYVKLVDFGFAKFIGYSTKTWTFCGTPEYVAPEVILNKGHDRAVDYWALGILIHELLTGTPPFTANDPMKTYNIILKGIDIIEFPRYVTRSAMSLIKRLCRDLPTDRLGYQRGGVEDIKKHRWFQGFDWDGLANLSLTPPKISQVNGPLDLSNFDTFPSDDSPEPPDETSGWDKDF